MSATYATILWENFDRGKLLETCPIIILNWIHLSEAFIFWTASLSPYMQVTYQLAKAGKGKAQLGTAQAGCTNLLITKWPPLMSGHYSCRIPPPFIVSPRLNISYHSEIQPLLQNSVFHWNNKWLLIWSITEQHQFRRPTAYKFQQNTKHGIVFCTACPLQNLC